MPVYRIDLPGNELPRAVEADTPAQAIQHVVKDSVTVRRLDVSEAFALAVEGVALERAGETPPAAEPEPVDLGDANESDAKRDIEARPMDEPREGYARDPDDGDGAEFAEVEDDDQQARAPFDAGDEELEGN